MLPRPLYLPRYRAHDKDLVSVFSRIRRPCFRTGCTCLSGCCRSRTTTCGPTCLHAICRYRGADEALDGVIARTRKLVRGGTVAVFLACDALRRGYQATIYAYNPMVFDPTWFARGVDLGERLQQQRQVKKDARLQNVTEGYREFLNLGGWLRLTDMSRPLIRGLLRRRLPIRTGLSSTYLYRAAREHGPDDRPDDVRGAPAGHFFVMARHDRKERSIPVAHPYGPHPYGPSHDYWISIEERKRGVPR